MNRNTVVRGITAAAVAFGGLAVATTGVANAGTPAPCTASELTATAGDGQQGQDPLFRQLVVEFKAKDGVHCQLKGLPGELTFYKDGKPIPVTPKVKDADRAQVIDVRGIDTATLIVDIPKDGAPVTPTDEVSFTLPSANADVIRLPYTAGVAETPTISPVIGPTG
ncbi:hypothetical protein [Allokutzneria albata]|uniref:DUF4232 domain-containing protein n=1 Tax=Allokutzneria albata TaxID=211114 RepID=A0A1H0A238_ALLAB|nr:hypothetical protein [Allokutzneria albata]SDN27515.1 hypothetical protein SAMN04489726_5834 [Allokutzneria albata]